MQHSCKYVISLIIHLFHFALLTRMLCGPIFIIYRETEASSVLNITNELLISKEKPGIIHVKNTL